ncbi:MAG: nuclease-related domain-containing protein [Egibacteraceae bacterium]
MRHDEDRWWDESQPGVSVRELTAADLDRYTALLESSTPEDRQPRSGAQGRPGKPETSWSRGLGWANWRMRPGRPGASAYAEYRRRRSRERQVWLRTRPRRLALMTLTAAAASVVGAVLPGPFWLIALPATGWALWSLRFRPTADALAWKRGAAGERATGRALRKFERAGWVVLHDRAIPGSKANLDRLVVGPAGVFVIDSKRWRGRIWTDANGVCWCGSYPLDRAVEGAWWQAHLMAEAIAVDFFVLIRPLLCVHPPLCPAAG